MGSSGADVKPFRSNGAGSQEYHPARVRLLGDHAVLNGHALFSTIHSAEDCPQDRSVFHRDDLTSRETLKFNRLLVVAQLNDRVILGRWVLTETAVDHFQRHALRDGGHTGSSVLYRQIPLSRNPDVQLVISSTRRSGATDQVRNLVEPVQMPHRQ